MNSVGDKRTEGFRKVVGERIRFFRIQRGLSQEELAKLCGYTSRSTIARIEKGQNEFPQSKFKELAKALGVTAIDLMGFEDDGSIKSESPSLSDQIKAEHGQTVASAFDLFLRLDESDQILIIGQMQGILLASEKYQKKESSEPKAI